MKSRFGTAGTRHCGGFTLVELLVVLAIIVVMVALVIPAFTSMNRGAQLSNAAQMVIAQLNRARQEALTDDRQVEVRFYNTGSLLSPVYPAMRYFVLTDTGTTSAAAENVQYLPIGVIISSGTRFSTWASLPASVSASGTIQQENIAPHGGVTSGTGVNFVCFHFRPNGETDLNSGTNSSGANINWFWTLRNQYDTPPDSTTATTLPANFATIQLDPVTGIVRLYRP